MYARQDRIIQPRLFWILNFKTVFFLRLQFVSREFYSIIRRSPMLQCSNECALNIKCDRNGLELKMGTVLSHCVACVCLVELGANVWINFKYYFVVQNWKKGHEPRSQCYFNECFCGLWLMSLWSWLNLLWFFLENNLKFFLFVAIFKPHIIACAHCYWIYIQSVRVSSLYVDCKSVQLQLFIITKTKSFSFHRNWADRVLGG